MSCYQLLWNITPLLTYAFTFHDAGTMFALRRVNRQSFTSTETLRREHHFSNIIRREFHKLGLSQQFWQALQQDQGQVSGSSLLNILCADQLNWTCGDVDVYTKQNGAIPRNPTQDQLYGAVENYCWDRAARLTKQYAIHSSVNVALNEENSYGYTRRRLFNYVRTYNLLLDETRAQSEFQHQTRYGFWEPRFATTSNNPMYEAVIPDPQQMNRIQVIQIDNEYQRIEQFIGDEFDLDFLKNIFDGKTLIIHHQQAFMQRRSEYHLLCQATAHHLNRYWKYCRRGFHITGVVNNTQHKIYRDSLMISRLSFGTDTLQYIDHVDVNEANAFLDRLCADPAYPFRMLRRRDSRLFLSSRSSGRIELSLFTTDVNRIICD